MEFSVSVEGLDRLASKSRLVAKIAEEETRKALLASAFLVEKEAKESIAGGPKTGRLYKRRRVVHQASAPGEAPASDTGRLLNSINARPVQGELAAEVKAGGGIVKYARMLEFGTPRMAARPFLFRALQVSKAAIRARMEKALERTIERAAKKGIDSLR
jgi:HK97 gp10 family phage protein